MNKVFKYLIGVDYPTGFTVPAGARIEWLAYEDGEFWAYIEHPDTTEGPYDLFGIEAVDSMSDRVPPEGTHLDLLAGYNFYRVPVKDLRVSAPIKTGACTCTEAADLRLCPVHGDEDFRRRIHGGVTEQ